MSNPPTDTAEGPAWSELPAIDLRPLRRLTDDTGMFQHALFATPDPRHGYCIDDNARALIAALVHARLRGYDERVVPLNRYLAFLTYAFNEELGQFRNFMGYDRRWLEDFGSHDSQGRTIWTLGLAVAMAPHEHVRELAQTYFFRGVEQALPQLVSIRSWAFAILGFEAYLEHDPADETIRRLRADYAQKLLDAYHASASDDWPWWESPVTYDNAKLPHAMIVAGRALGRRDMLDVGLATLRWLLEIQTGEDGRLSIIGNRGWYPKGGEKAEFDQQPLEAWAMVHACLVAAEADEEATGDESWTDAAWRCYRWFRGFNDLGVSLIDDEHGGCFDGLHSEGVNRNQGAESVLAYLLTVLELHRYQEGRTRSAATIVGGGDPTRPLGLGIVSASGFADFVLDQLIDHRSGDNKDDAGPAFRPAAVWSRTADRAEAMARSRGLRRHDSLDALVNDPEVEAVYVAGVPATHAEQAIAALRAGRHVLVEKPLALGSVDAQAMIHAAAERDARLAVNHVMRYGPLYDPVAAILASGALGKPLRGTLINAAGDAGLPEGHWFWDEALSGGIFIEHAVHFFDLLRGWLGEAGVTAAYRLRRGETDLIDQCGCELRYGSETTLGMYHGFTQCPPLDRQRLDLVCERGELSVRGWVATELDIHAVLSEHAVDAVANALPAEGRRVETLRRFTGSDRHLRIRHVAETVDREVRITWTSPNDKQHVYGRACRDLLNDFRRAIADPHHRMKVTAEDARTAVELAVEADRQAKRATP